MAQRIPSWLYETLKVWAQYLAVGVAVTPVAYMHATDVIVYAKTPWAAFASSAALATVFATVAWAATGGTLDMYELVREVRELRETVAATHDEICQEQQEVIRLKAETRGMIERLRTAA